MNHVSRNKLAQIVTNYGHQCGLPTNIYDNLWIKLVPISAHLFQKAVRGDSLKSYLYQGMRLKKS